MKDPVEITVREGIGQVVIDHPPLNILTRAVLASLRAAFLKLESDESVRVVVLQARGKHFSAGADVGEHMPPEYRDLIPEFIDTIATIDAFQLPVLAAVQGLCLGGGFELVQAADLILAAEDASFGQPEIALGVFPPAACALLPRWVPLDVAAEVVLTGDSIPATEAERVGLVRKVVPKERLEEEAMLLAHRMARHSRTALRLTKRALRADTGDRRSGALTQARDLYLDELMETADAIEGLSAFQEKREPVWSHR